jgi:hypothetical protein
MSVTPVQQEINENKKVKFTLEEAMKAQRGIREYDEH